MRMPLIRHAAAAQVLVALPGVAGVAHDSPYSYLNVVADSSGIRGTLDVTNIDVRHVLRMLGRAPPDDFEGRANLVDDAVRGSIAIRADGTALPLTISSARSCQIRGLFGTTVDVSWTCEEVPAQLEFSLWTFPYDPEHVTLFGLVSTSVHDTPDLFHRFTTRDRVLTWAPVFEKPHERTRDDPSDTLSPCDTVDHAATTKKASLREPVGAPDGADEKGGQSSVNVVETPRGRSWMIGMVAVVAIVVTTLLGFRMASRTYMRARMARRNKP